MSKKRMITKSVIFLLILAFILKIFSSLSIAMGYNANPLYNYSSYSIFQEPDNSIDVLSIGDSNVYSSIFPLVWWEQQGFTGYTWGQPSQRIPETYEYLKKIYKHQKPSIVLIDGNNLFRDKTDIDNLDSITKAKLATIFPVISFPVLISVPNYNGWNYQKHNALQEIADKNGINLVDLNLELKKQINWKKDSVDGGDHLNIKGAKKTSAYLGEYLKKEYGLPDRRGTTNYKQWDNDVEEWEKLMLLDKHRKVGL